MTQDGHDASRGGKPDTTVSRSRAKTDEKTPTSLPPREQNAGALDRSNDAGAPAAQAAAQADVEAFVAQIKSRTPPQGVGRGRLVFAMDATMSREPTWDMALGLQATMFDAVRDVGGLDVQLVFFRGAGECRASKWVSDPTALSRLMTSVSCRGGFTQIGKVLNHAARENEAARVNALVYVGDCTEEDIDDLCGRAGELALQGVPVFVFQEGHDAKAARAFKEIARLTRGAHCAFDAGAASQLRALLTAVATYAAGGRRALEALSAQREGQGAQLLLEQLDRR
ncbi:MAG: VWA domain-containing protein [Pseudomonadota bacterium]